MWTYLIFVCGIVMLVLCGDALVKGAVALAVRLNIPTLVTGLTIVAFGTSTPELMVSLKAALTGAPGIAVGNVVGSNIANILMVLGVPALIYATNCDQPMLKRNTVFVIGTSVLFIVLCFLGPLQFWHGAILFSLMVYFLIDTGMRAMKSERLAEIISEDAKEILEGPEALHKRPWRIAGLLAIGLIGLPIAGKYTVESAQVIALDLGVSNSVIGLTMVAIGTSLPELVTTVMAAIRRECGLILGNVLGSNLFNILVVMGITSMVTPVPIPQEFLTMDLWIMLAASLAIVPFVFRNAHITPAIGTAFLVCYALYIYAAFVPGAAKASGTGDDGINSANISGFQTGAGAAAK
ncbi:MAG: calcium/sodium antiporter [Methyloligellaceae bacterium]